MPPYIVYRDSDVSKFSGFLHSCKWLCKFNVAALKASCGITP